MRIGNQAHEHFQHNTDGNLILGAAQAFIYDRLFIQAGLRDFCKLKLLGERAFQLYNEASLRFWSYDLQCYAHFVKRDVRGFLRSLSELRISSWNTIE